MSRNGYIKGIAGQQVATGLYRIGAIKDKNQSPDGAGFRLKLHETNPNAPLSPVYIDLRLLQSFPALLSQTATLYLQLVEQLSFDLIAGIPVAAVPTATVISQLCGKPMITPRMSEKGHGSGAKVDGVYQADQTVLLVDDLCTKAGSKLEAIKVLEEAGLVVKDVVVLVDREQGGGKELADAGYTLHAAFTLRELLGFYLENGMMSQALYKEIMAYLG
ncbi:MAG: phosphoribosyltransferase family protein [Candidatus Buchananbacteria bacterium]